MLVVKANIERELRILQSSERFQCWKNVTFFFDGCVNLRCHYLLKFAKNFLIERINVIVFFPFLNDPTIHENMCPHIEISLDLICAGCRMEACEPGLK